MRTYESADAFCNIPFVWSVISAAAGLICGLPNDSRCLEDESRFLKNHAVPRKPAIPTNEMYVNCLFTYYVAREIYSSGNHHHQQQRCLVENTVII
jgi:hypothetical protein